MKNILIISLITLLGITGCAENNRCNSSNEGKGCELLKVLFRNLENQNVHTVVFFGEDSNEPIDEDTLKEIQEGILTLAGCCVCKPHPLSNEWTECNRLECIWEHLEKENVQRIAFYEQILGENTERPEDWCNLRAEIKKPERIKEIMKILRKAMKKEKDRTANVDTVMSDIDRMQITTDKHKFIIPVGCASRQSKVIYGIGWTSYELRGRLKEWGFPAPNCPAPNSSAGN